MARASAVFQPDGSFSITVDCEVGAYVMEGTAYHLTDAEREQLKQMPVEELQKLVDAARERFADGLIIHFDGQSIQPTVEFPSAATIQLLASGRETPRLPPILVLGQAPTDAAAMAIRFPADIDQIQLTVTAAGAASPIGQLLRGGQPSWPFLIRKTAAIAPPDWRQVAGHYLILGYEHILPEGLDHILFVLGLFLLSPQLKPLLFQVTAFTLAHSVTLALAIFGVVRLSPAIVEPLIALSIAYVAIENLCTSKLHSWRIAIVFLFGLIHGLGFAGVLGDIGLPPNEAMTSLVMFNIGVEAGQLSVIALACLAVGWFRDRPWYHSRIVVPASILIAAIGLYWTVQRVFG